MGFGIPLNLSWARLYTITGMNVAADLVTGLWVVAVELVAVGVGSTGRIGFTGKVGLMGIGWAITLILNLLFTGTLVLLFCSAFLGVGAFLGEESVLGEVTLMHV